MISVGIGDARKAIGFGSGGGGIGREMEETELEEGEAYSFQNNGDYDASIDPDIDFSYIDEKVQNFLGHFQKDFEGGVSAENLGAKFGGYGSFLPTYQRSPVWSHPKTPPKLQNYSISKSPNNLWQEGGLHNSFVPSTVPQSARAGPPSTASTTLPVMKGPTMNVSVKEEIRMPSTCVEELGPPRNGSGNKKLNSLTDQKTLKVRIKVGADNLLTQKNAAIYSGLGLDVSPSSSLDNSPSDKEGVSRELQGAPYESPTSILQAMTSFPVQGGRLLSPLPDHLIHMTSHEKPLNNHRSVLVPRSGQESSGAVRYGSNFVKHDEALGEGKMKSAENKIYSTGSELGKFDDYHNGIVFMSKKEAEVDTLTCGNNAKTLPLWNSCSAAAEVAKNIDRVTDMSREAINAMTWDKVISEQVGGDLSEPPFLQEDGFFENQKSGSGGKVYEEKKASSVDDISVLQKDSHVKGKRNLDKVKANLKGKKNMNSEVMNSPRQKADQKISSHEDDSIKSTPGNESLLPEGKKKLKGSQNNGALAGDVPNGSVRVASSSMPKNCTKMDDSKIELGDVKPQKDSGKSGDRYRDFFGELEEEEEEENRVSKSEVAAANCLNHSDMFDKRASTTSSKGRSTVKSIEKPLTSEAYPKTASHVATHSTNGIISDAIPAAVDAVVVEDNWVSCDKCLKWRLLPLGTNPANLPEKWLCTMLNWLPGMNRCSVSEEETTKALIALYQAPAPQNHSNVHSNPGGVPLGATSANAWQPDQSQNHRNASLLAMPGGSRKKLGSKEITNTTNKGGSTQLSNPINKNVQDMMNGRSLNDMTQSPLGNEKDFKHQSKKPNDVAVEKRKHKHIEKQEAHDLQIRNGGDMKSLKIKSRMEPKLSDHDLTRASKRVKAEGVDFIDEDQMSNHSGAIKKVGQSLSGGFPSNSVGKKRPKHGEHASKYNVKDRGHDFVEKRANQVHVSLGGGPIGLGDGDTKDRAKKRKAKDCQDSHGYQGSLHSAGHLQGDTGFMKEGFSENDCKKEKKARISKSEGKESDASKLHSKTERKGTHKKDPNSKRNSDGVDSLKKDLGSIQPSAAATSSSSKISGSQKNKSSFQEVKGSPVESVSSSPMRISNPDKLMDPIRDLKGKHGSQRGGLFGTSSPKRCSDGEDGGSDRSGTRGKDVVAHRRSLESSVLDSSDTDRNHMSGSKARPQVMSSNIPNHRLTNCDLDNPGKSEKGSSSWLKDNNQIYNTDFVKDKVKVSGSHDEWQERSPTHLRQPRDGKNKVQENSVINSNEMANKYVAKKDSLGRLSSQSAQRESELNCEEHDSPDVRVDTSCKKDTMISSGEKLQPLPASGGKSEKTSSWPRPLNGTQKVNAAEKLEVDHAEGDALAGHKQNRKADQNGIQQIRSRHPIQNGRRANAPSPTRRDSSNQAATDAVKEATNLKHLADRLKHAGSTAESTGLYFQAALKFLHGASLLESSNSETIQSVQMYSSTAKLCEFCAHEFEKIKDMATAALAYKCMEVAYMRVIYSSHTNTSKDRHELQAALQIIPPGESPSSSASDVDNLTNPSTVDKVALPKGVSSPQVTGGQLIAAQNRPNFVRLLNFAQDVNFAMEASRKSRVAFAAASMSSEGAKSGEAISSIKRALDFNFQDVEGLLRLVRVAMEAISR